MIITFAARFQVTENLFRGGGEGDEKMVVPPEERKFDAFRYFIVSESDLADLSGILFYCICISCHDVFALLKRRYFSLSFYY